MTKTNHEAGKQLFAHSRTNQMAEAIIALPCGVYSTKEICDLMESSHATLVGTYSSPNSVVSYCLERLAEMGLVNKKQEGRVFPKWGIGVNFPAATGPVVLAVTAEVTLESLGAKVDELTRTMSELVARMNQILTKVG